MRELAIAHTLVRTRASRLATERIADILRDNTSLRDACTTLGQDAGLLVGYAYADRKADVLKAAERLLVEATAILVAYD